jgi:hypothetical protein
MLRGPQTPGELNQRTARLHAFAGLGEIHATLALLAERDLAERLERRPGQKEERYRHLLGEPEAAPRGESQATAPTDVAPATLDTGGDAPAGLATRVTALEAEVARLREALEELDAGPQN